MNAWLKRWKWVGLFLLLFFASAEPAGSVVRDAYGLLGEDTVRRIVMVVVLGILAAPVLLRILQRHEYRSPGFLLRLFVLGALYAVCLTRLAPYPIEKIHFLSYGILAYLVYTALQERQNGNIWIQSFSLVAFFGFLDELYQGLLPSRRYDDQDILVNLTAGLLGLALTQLLKHQRPKPLTTGMGHVSNLPYLLLWPLSGALYLFIHAVPLPSETVLGTWHRVGDCRVQEWLRLGPDGSLLWWDEDGNRARGDYRITGNRLEGIYFNNRGIEAQNRSDCGYRPGLVMNLKIRVDADRLLYVHGPDKPWTREPRTAPDGENMAPKQPNQVNVQVPK